MTLNFDLDKDRGLTEDQKLIRNAVRGFAEKEIKPVILDVIEDESFSYDLTEKMRENGLFGMYLPKEYGGNGCDTLSYILAVEEIARVDGSQAATLLAQNSLGIGPWYNYGTEEQKSFFLKKLSEEGKLWGFGLTEPDAGSDALRPKMTAKWTPRGWLLNGEKIFITNASTDITLGSSFLALAEDEQGNKKLTTFYVMQNHDGFSQVPMKRKMVWRNSNTSSLVLKDCLIPHDQILGAFGQGHKIMMQTLDNGRLSVAAAGLGLAQGAYEMALKYSMEREQLGNKIGLHQALTFKLVDMATDIVKARMLLYDACRIKDEDEPLTRIAAMAKYDCTELAVRVANDGVQILGGYGLMEEYHMERFYRDARILTIGEGTSEIQKIVIAGKLGLVG